MEKNCCLPYKILCHIGSSSHQQFCKNSVITMSEEMSWANRDDESEGVLEPNPTWLVPVVLGRVHVRTKRTPLPSFLSIKIILSGLRNHQNIFVPLATSLWWYINISSHCYLFLCAANAYLKFKLYIYDRKQSALWPQVHTWYLLREPRVYPCKFFLPGVNFYRFNAKNWQFTV